MSALAAPFAPSPAPGMRLLLLAEQTAPRGSILHDGLVYLAPLKTRDGRLSFQPALNTTTDEDDETFVSLSLKLTNYESTGQFMVHCKLIGGRHRTRTRSGATLTPVIVQERVLLKPKTSLKDVLWMSLRDIIRKMTVVFLVYDVVAPHPAMGAGLHLNRARLQGTMCDVKLLVEGVELAAHRTVLAVRSPVLSNMLTGDFREAREGRIELVDASRAAVEKFLEFLYTDQVQTWANSELELLQLADKYMVPELRNECCLRLWSSNPPRALEALYSAATGLCDTMGSPLRQRLTAIVVENIEGLANTARWAELKAAYPVFVDIMLGSVANAPKLTSCVWSP